MIGPTIIVNYESTIIREYRIQYVTIPAAVLYNREKIEELNNVQNIGGGILSRGYYTVTQYYYLCA
jgi:hypothetical protein